MYLQQSKEESFQLIITDYMNRFDLVRRGAVQDLHISVQCVSLGLDEPDLQRKHYFPVYLCAIGIVRLAQDSVQVIGIGLPSVFPDVRVTFLQRTAHILRQAGSLPPY